jgi:hypothetical protein
MFSAAHWAELARQGYTVVSRAIDERMLRAAQAASNHLNAVHPDEGWERSKNESWREVRHCRHPAFMALASEALDPLALEILESAPPRDFVQLAVTMPGFATRGGVGRHFHVDGGQDRALDVFNILFGVALTDVSSDTAGGFHVLPGSHERMATLCKSKPDGTHWGELKLECQKEFLKDANLVVPRLAAGDIVVTHSFVFHGTSANTTATRRDMLFQRRAAQPLWDPASQAAARQAFMRDPWIYFRPH